MHLDFKIRNSVRVINYLESIGMVGDVESTVFAERVVKFGFPCLELM